jgi:hypothetical protein
MFCLFCAFCGSHDVEVWNETALDLYLSGMIRTAIHVVFIAAFAFGIQLQCGVWCVDLPAPSCHEENLPASHTCSHPQFVNDAGTINPQKADISVIKPATTPSAFAAPLPRHSSTTSLDRFAEIPAPAVLPLRPLRI